MSYCRPPPLKALKHDVDKCALAQTLLFVAANKVCTAQYFLWWLPLLIVVVDDWRFMLRPLRNWVLSCGLWLLWHMGSSSSAYLCIFYCGAALCSSSGRTSLS